MANPTIFGTDPKKCADRMRHARGVALHKREPIDWTTPTNELLLFQARCEFRRLEERTELVWLEIVRRVQAYMVRSARTGTRRTMSISHSTLRKFRAGVDRPGLHPFPKKNWLRCKTALDKVYIDYFQDLTRRRAELPMRHKWNIRWFADSVKLIELCVQDVEELAAGSVLWECRPGDPSVAFMVEKTTNGSLGTRQMGTRFRSISHWPAEMASVPGRPPSPSGPLSLPSADFPD